MKDFLLCVFVCVFVLVGLANAWFQAVWPERFMSSRWTMKGTLPSFYDVNKTRDRRKIRALGAIQAAGFLFFLVTVLRWLFRKIMAE